MSCNTHDLGDLIRLTSAFHDADTGTDMDPEIVSVTIRDPDGNTQTLTYGTDAAVINSSTGHYYTDVDANVVGTWYYRWFSTGSGQAAEEQRFLVRPAHAL
jgi:hypothetical protein